MQFHIAAGKFKKVRRMLSIIIVTALIASIPGLATAKSDYDFYFFGIKLESFNDCNWLKVAAGAATSILVHELGHALYLEYAGKPWDFKASLSSGFAVQTRAHLSDADRCHFGRAGFALQTFVGTLLTTFKKTKRSDFTKGWIGINTVQVYSYRFRNHADGNDFKVIDQGGGNGNMENVLFSAMSTYNLRQLESNFVKFPFQMNLKPETNFFNDISETRILPNRLLGDTFDLPVPRASKSDIQLAAGYPKYDFRKMDRMDSLSLSRDRIENFSYEIGELACLQPLAVSANES